MKRGMSLSPHPTQNVVLYSLKPNLKKHISRESIQSKPNITQQQLSSVTQQFGNCPPFTGKLFVLEDCQNMQLLVLKMKIQQLQEALHLGKQNLRHLQDRRHQLISQYYQEQEQSKRENENLKRVLERIRRSSSKSRSLEIDFQQLQRIEQKLQDLEI